MLGWHYRSQGRAADRVLERAANIYDRTLTTFPGVARRRVPLARPGSVRAGPRRPGRARRRRGRAVVDSSSSTPSQRPNESLGVIAMGIKHANRIDEALRRARAEHAELDAFFDGTASTQAHDEPFFVKNLERVQGDERDAIILSIGYGKTADGRLPYRFGPINHEGGERRLNVAITRARAAHDARLLVLRRRHGPEQAALRGRAAAAPVPRSTPSRAEQTSATRAIDKPDAQPLRARRPRRAHRGRHPARRPVRLLRLLDRLRRQHPTQPRPDGPRHRVRRRQLPLLGNRPRPRPAAPRAPRTARLGFHRIWSQTGSSIARPRSNGRLRLTRGSGRGRR